MENLCFHKNSIKGNEANPKVVKMSGYFSLKETIGTCLNTEENNFERNSKSFD